MRILKGQLDSLLLSLSVNATKELLKCQVLCDEQAKETLAFVGSFRNMLNSAGSNIDLWGIPLLIGADFPSVRFIVDCSKRRRKMQRML
ncbi:unnamed protein product [Caretta caretta]